VEEQNDLVNVRFFDTHAAEIKRLAKEYGFPKAIVARMAVEHGMHPELGRLEDRLEALRIEREAERASAQEPLPPENPADVPAPDTAQANLSEVLRGLQEQMSALARQWADFLASHQPMSTGVVAAEVTETLPLALEETPPMWTDEDFMDAAEPESVRNLDTAQEAEISRIRDTVRGLRERMDALEDQPAPIVNPVVLADMQDRLRQIWERVESLGSAPAESEPMTAGISAESLEELRQGIEASLQGLRESLDSLVDTVALRLPQMVSDAVLEKMPGQQESAPSSALEERLAAIESFLNALADRQDAVLAAAAPTIDLSSLEDRLSRMQTNLQTLFAEMQRLASSEKQESRIAGVEEKVDQVLELLQTLIEESAKPFTLEPSKSFGKKWVGKLRVVKEG